MSVTCGASNDSVQITAVRMSGETIAQFEFSAVGSGSEMRKMIAVLGKIDTDTYDISLMVGETSLGDKQNLSEVCVQPKHEVTVSVVVKEAWKIKSWTNFMTSEDYEVCFGIKVHGPTVTGSVVHFTDCNDDYQYGSRIPRIFICQGTRLSASCGHTQAWNSEILTEALTCEREYNVRVRCQGQKQQVFLDDTLAVEHPAANGDRPSRIVEVHFGGGTRAGGPSCRQTPANASIRELTYVNLHGNQRHQLSNSTWVNLSEFKGEASWP